MCGLPGSEDEVWVPQTKWDGEEDMPKKRVVEEFPQGKKQPKKARTELEMALTVEAAEAIGEALVSWGGRSCGGWTS